MQADVSLMCEVQNDLTEFFHLLDFCNPGILGIKVVIIKVNDLIGSQSSFKQVFENTIAASLERSATRVERELGEVCERLIVEFS